MQRGTKTNASGAFCVCATTNAGVLQLRFRMTAKNKYADFTKPIAIHSEAAVYPRAMRSSLKHTGTC